jgi:polar amino acid transport system substrate-binding protein
MSRLDGGLWPHFVLSTFQDAYCQNLPLAPVEWTSLAINIDLGKYLPMRYNCLTMSSYVPERWKAVVGVVLCALAACTAQAKEVLVVGTTFARIYEQTETGEFIGLGAELARTIAQQQCLTLKFGIFPWARAQEMVANGSADVLVGPYKTPAREARFIFGDQPFYQDNMVFYKLAGSKASWDGTYESLKGKRLVAVLGWVYGTPFDQERANLGVTNANTVESGLTMLLNNRMDFFVANERNTTAGMAALGKYDQFAVVSPMIGKEVGYFAFTKDAESEELRQAFNAGMAKLIESGEYAAMAKRFSITMPAALVGKGRGLKPGGGK